MTHDAAAARRPGTAPRAVPRPWNRRFRLPVKIADAYLLTSVLEATLRGLFWFAGLLVAFAVISAVRRVVADQLPVSVMFELVLYQMPRAILFTLPISILYGTAQTFTELSTRGELTALGTGGMSLPRMVRAPLVLGVLLALIAFWLQESVVPRAERQSKDVARQSAMDSTAVQKDFRLSDLDNGRIIQADIFEPKTRTLINPSITLFNESKQVGMEIVAERAQWDIASGEWIFFNGRSRFTPRIESVNPKPEELPLGFWTQFEQLDVDVMPDPEFLKEQTRTINYHLDKKNYEMLSITDLRSYLNKQPLWLAEVTSPKVKEDILRRMRSLKFGIHDKIATPLVCLVVILIGAPLGVRPQRSASAGIAMGMSLVALLVYYIVWSWSSQIGKAGLGNPYVMAYLPITLTLLIGLVLLKMKSR